MSRSTTTANPFQFQGFDATSELFRAPTKPKKGYSGAGGSSPGGGSAAVVSTFLKRAGAVSRKAPEVMVRITGAAKGKQHVKEHLAYITRNGKLEAVNERGETITGRLAVKDLAEEWLAGAPKEHSDRRAPDTRNLILSMPAGSDPELVLRAAKTFADKTFAAERTFALVLHTEQGDTKSRAPAHPHVHLTLKTRGFDGHNLNPRKADLQHWREEFAKELRALGVAAEATPRRARGVVQKPKHIAVHHMEQSHQAGKVRKDGTPRAPAAQLAKFAEAVREITGKDGPKVRPWEVKIAERQEKIRGGWLATAGVLDKHPAPEAKQLAADIRKFVAEMPPVQTERQKIHAQLAGKLDRDRTRTPGQERI